MSTYQEFYCDAATGSNLNAGDNKTIVTSTNGDWGNAAANRFTAASGTPFSGVSVGDFASVYTDGATVGVYIARVTAVNSGGASITLSSSAKAGTAPSNSATGRSCTVGGKWKGPNAAEIFPFNLNTLDGLQDASNNRARINFKNGTTYAITAAITQGTSGAVGITFEGYATSPGDGGRFVIDGGTSGASYILLTLTFGNLYHAELKNNGATGSASGLQFGSAGSPCRDVIVHDVRGSGIAVTANNTLFSECEVYSANASNTSGKGGIEITNTGGGYFKRVEAHDNAGSNSFGFGGSFGGDVTLENCIADTNGGVGISGQNSFAQSFRITNSDSYNNGSHGISLPSALGIFIENCNLVKNGGWGISATGAVRGTINNCGYGSGTQANTSGTSTLPSTSAAVTETGAVTYAADVTPWVDPANGDFRINLATAKGAGRGTFVQTAASYAGTVGYPDIGAAQHQDSGGGGTSIPAFTYGARGVLIG